MISEKICGFAKNVHGLSPVNPHLAPPMPIYKCDAQTGLRLSLDARY